MSYCRFQNTLDDLLDCRDHLWDDDLSADEAKARKALSKLCKIIADETEDSND